MNRDALQRRLTRLLEATVSAKGFQHSSWWVGDKAGERRVFDDYAAGREHWRSAHNLAQQGLKALEKDDLEMAELCAWTATDLYVATLEIWVKRVRPPDRPKLTRSAEKRGRPRKK
jgi:hypothetical protein